MTEERIDQLINNICGYIERRIEEDDLESGKDVSETTKALAALVEARAGYTYEKHNQLKKTEKLSPLQQTKEAFASALHQQSQ